MAPQNRTARRCCVLGVVLALGAVIGGLASSANAMIVVGSDGYGNTTAPAGDSAWSYVGRINSSSCVYLGDGWMISAFHVNNGSQTSASLNGVSYAINASSYTQLHAPGDATSLADLCMFQLTTTPQGLGSMAVNTAALSAGRQFTAIGYGKIHDASGLQYWNVSDTDNNGTYTWTTASASNHDFSGFIWGSNAKAWGTNNILNLGNGAIHETVVNNVAISSTKYVATTTTVFESDFSLGAGVNEMQAAMNDSGSGVFCKINNKWTLAGITLGIGTHTDYDQPSNYAVYGDVSAYADLSVYASQISSVMAVPEPGVFALLLTAGVSGFLLLRRASLRPK